MADSPIYRVRFRRRREGKTDYRRRLALIRSGKTRLVVRKTLSNVYAQLVEFRPDGDRTVASVSGTALGKLAGWKRPLGNLPAAYLVGYALGKRASGAEAVLDIGMQHPAKGGRLFAVVKGAIDGGLKVACDESAFPLPERAEGAHISPQVREDFLAAKKRIDGGGA